MMTRRRERRGGGGPGAAPHGAVRTTLAAVAVAVAVLAVGCGDADPDPDPDPDPAAGSGTGGTPVTEEGAGDAGAPGTDGGGTLDAGTDGDGTGGAETGGDGGSDGDDGTSRLPTSGTALVASVSLVDVPADDVVPSDRGFVEASFERYDADFLNEQLALADGDACLVESFSDPDDAAIVEYGLDAGENVVVSSPAGTLLTLERVEERGGEGGAIEFYYDSAVSGAVDGFLPNALTLDVPGAVFPALTAAPLPDAPPPFARDADLFAPVADETITAATTFSWRPGGEGADSGVLLSIEAGDPATDLHVFCLAIDDGSFAFPEDTVTALGPDFGALADATDIRRARVGLHRDGEALLVSIHLVESADDRAVGTGSSGR